MNENEPVRLPTTLRFSFSTVKSSHVLGVMAVILLLMLTVLILFVHGVYSKAGEKVTTAQGVLDAVWAEFTQDPQIPIILGGLIVLLPLALLLSRAQRRAWMRLTPTGLQAHIPRRLGGRGPMQQSTGDWDVAWDEVRRVRLARSRRAHIPLYCLAIETDRGELRLLPFSWLNPSEPDHRLSIWEANDAGHVLDEKRLESAPLIRILEARGFEIQRVSPGKEQSRPAGFDLSKHKGMLLQIGLMLMAALYGLGDAFFVGMFLPLQAMPRLPYVLVGGLALLVVWVTGLGAPKTERLVVGLFASSALVAAAYPATLRVNAMTATPEVVEYVAIAPGWFEAPGDGLPELDLTGEFDVPEYWAEYPPGSTHEFTLLRGQAGFYQLDPKPLLAQTRAFYKQRKNED